MKLFNKEIKFNKRIKPKEIIKPVLKELPKEDVNPESVDTEKKVGLMTKLDQVNVRLDMLTQRDKKLEHKEFKLPGKIQRQMKKIALQNKVFVIYLKRNRTMIPMITEIIDGFIIIDGVPHNCSTDFTFLWKGKYPAIVLPEWDLNPIGTNSYYEAVKDKRIADPVAIVIRMLEAKENLMKGQGLKISPKAWIFIGLAIVAGIYVLMGGAG